MRMPSQVRGLSGPPSPTREQPGFRELPGRSLNVRESSILLAIIEQHIVTAQPVPSSHVARLPQVGLSSASVRAVMAELTSLGYLSQPHTSAGRVPTAKALKLYVERLSRMSSLDGADRALIEAELLSAEREIMAILKHAANLLARRGGQVGMVLAPDQDEARLKSIAFVPAATGVVLAVLELDGGMVSTCAVHPHEIYSSDDLLRFGNFLTQRFANSSLAEMRAGVYSETNSTGRRLEDMCLRALGLSRLALEHLEAERELFVNGAANLFGQAEFSDLSSMRGMLELIEDRSRLLDLLDATLQSGSVSITLSPEQGDGLESCAMISAPFGHTTLGVVSLFGPLRMDYARLIPVVQGVSSALTACYTQHLTKAQG